MKTYQELETELLDSFSDERMKAIDKDSHEFTDQFLKQMAAFAAAFTIAAIQAMDKDSPLLKKFEEGGFNGTAKMLDKNKAIRMMVEAMAEQIMDTFRNLAANSDARKELLIKCVGYEMEIDELKAKVAQYEK